MGFFDRFFGESALTREKMNKAYDSFEEGNSLKDKFPYRASQRYFEAAEKFEELGGKYKKHKNIARAQGTSALNNAIKYYGKKDIQNELSEKGFKRAAILLGKLEKEVGKIPGLKKVKKQAGKNKHYALQRASELSYAAAFIGVCFFLALFLFSPNLTGDSIVNISQTNNNFLVALTTILLVGIYILVTR